jgi:hypothetical protein
MTGHNETKIIPSGTTESAAIVASVKRGATLTSNAALVREQVNRLLAHPLFTNSKRYPVLLAYTVEQALLGNAGELKERTIGVEAFGREPSYDVNLDPVVRTTAAEVRKKLIQYYYSTEHAGELVIELPLGSYVPSFRELAPHSSASTDTSVTAQHIESLPRNPVASEIPLAEPKREFAHSLYHRRRGDDLHGHRISIDRQSQDRYPRYCFCIGHRSSHRGIHCCRRHGSGTLTEHDLLCSMGLCQLSAHADRSAAAEIPRSLTSCRLPAARHRCGYLLSGSVRTRVVGYALSRSRYRLRTSRDERSLGNCHRSRFPWRRLHLPPDRFSCPDLLRDNSYGCHIEVVRLTGELISDMRFGVT